MTERAALARLLSVCERMDAENQMKRPTELAYQRALAAARKALKTNKSGKITQADVDSFNLSMGRERKHAPMQDKGCVPGGGACLLRQR